MDESRLPEEPEKLKTQDYTPDMVGVLGMLSKAFDRYIKGLTYPVMEMGKKGKRRWIGMDSESNFRLIQDPMLARAQNLSPLVNPREIQNWLVEKGRVESALAAAEELIPQYDYGIGIAKKGLWLSFIFSMMGLETRDYVVIRNGPGSRIGAPMHTKDPGDFEGKRILIFENDAITGESLACIPRLLLEARVKCQAIDVLLISRYAHVDEECYEAHKSRLAKGQYLGQSETGKHVIDTFSQIPPKFIRNKMSLESDFGGRNGNIHKLRETLRAKIHGK